MSEVQPIPDSDARMLARLAELDLAAAERAHARMMAADDDAFDQAARTYQRMARSLRQTLLLKTRSDQDHARQARETQDRAATAAKVRRAERKERLALEMERILEDVLDDSAADIAIMDLETRVDLAALTPGFDDETDDQVIARLCGFYRIPAPAWADDPAPPIDDST